jgi:hypothetical protein
VSLGRVSALPEDAGMKLDRVVTDVLGKSARATLAALIAGPRDPKVLAELAVGPMRPKADPLEQARGSGPRGSLAMRLVHGRSRCRRCIGRRRSELLRGGDRAVATVLGLREGWRPRAVVGTAGTTPSRPGASAPGRHDEQGWGLSPGHWWGPTTGHQRGLFHGHGQRRSGRGPDPQKVLQ